MNDIKKQVKNEQRIIFSRDKYYISTLSIYFLKRDIIMWKLTKSIVPLLLNIFINFRMNSLQVCIDIYCRNSANEL